MTSPVKPRTTHRQRQAQATRDLIAETARRLFAADGYGATSMETIARQAGVSARTVYAAFGAKREILSAICERWLEQAGARELAGQVLAEPDPARRLRGAAHWLRVLYSAGFDIVLIFEAATDESPQTRALLRAKLAGRNEVMDAIIASLDGHLAVPLRQAQAMYRALAAPGVYRELVEDSGWTPDDFEHWVSGTLQRNLMAPGHPGPPRSGVDRRGRPRPADGSPGG